MDKPKLYVGCALTHATEAYRESIEQLRTRLASDFEILQFLGLSGGTERDVYQRDIDECVGEADLFVAMCDHPSIGLGLELGAALFCYEVPTLALAHEDATVTRIVRGIPPFPGESVRPFGHSDYEFRRYRGMEHAHRLIVARAHECRVLAT